MARPPAVDVPWGQPHPGRPRRPPPSAGIPLREPATGPDRRGAARAGGCATVVSANGNASGTVTVVLRRPITPARRALTLLMTRQKGASASIFAANPNC